MFGNLAEAALKYRTLWGSKAITKDISSNFQHATNNKLNQAIGSKPLNITHNLGTPKANPKIQKTFVPNSSTESLKGGYQSGQEWVFGDGSSMIKPLSKAQRKNLPAVISTTKGAKSWRSTFKEFASSMFTPEATSNMMKGMKMAALGGAMGFGTALLGSAVAPDLVSVDRPVSSIVKGALAGAALGALGGGAKSVNALNKGAAYGVPTFSKWTQSAANSPVTRGALFAATFAGSIDVGSSVQPYNRNRRA